MKTSSGGPWRGGSRRSTWGVDKRAATWTLDHPGLGRADDDASRHVRTVVPGRGQLCDGYPLIWPSNSSAKNDGCRSGEDGAESREGAFELPGSGTRDRVVKGDYESCRSGRIEALFDDFPGLEIVGKRDGAEVMTEGRAHAGRDGQHRADTGYECHLHVAPFLWSPIHCFAYGGSHSEYARVAS